MNKVIILIACFAFTSAQLPLQNGNCPNFNEWRDPSVEMRNEDIMGVWYLISTVPFFFQLTKKCTYFNYTALPEPNTAHLDITEFDEL